MEVEEEAEESKWQDRISSGFDRLVAFASTELDKRRRSTDGENCNTSPDSGIGHGDPPPAIVTAVPIKPIIKLHPNPKPSLLKSSGKSLNIASPPLPEANDETGPPRTPSPSSPPNLPISFSPSLPNPVEKSPTRLNPALLKYQRHTEERKHKPDQHFKKKFYYREQWRDNTWQKRNDEHHTSLIKDKFKPKGKDWNWNKDLNAEYRNVEQGNTDWNHAQDQYGEWKN